MTYDELRAHISDLQKSMQPINHKLENPRLTHVSRVSLECQLRELKIFWYDAMCDLHAMPEYTGANSFQKENNPFR